MLAESLAWSLGSLVAFGLVSGMKGRVWAYLRVALGIVAAVSTLCAAGDFFEHPGWAGSLEQGWYSGRAPLLFMVAYLLGPPVWGCIFLTVAVLLFGSARLDWLAITGREQVEVEKEAFAFVRRLFHPIEAAKALLGWLRVRLVLPKVIALLAACIVSAGLLMLAAANRYEISGISNVARLDRLTGEVVPCVRREERKPEGGYRLSIECGAGVSSN